MNLGGGGGKGSIYEHVTAILPHSQTPVIQCPFNKRTAFLRGDKNDSLLFFSVAVNALESMHSKDSDQPKKKRKITEDIKLTTQTEQKENALDGMDFYPWLGSYKTADQMVGYLSDLIEHKICGPYKVTHQEEEALALEKRLKSREHANDALISPAQMPEYFNILAWAKYHTVERENAIMKHLQEDNFNYDVCFKTRDRLLILTLASKPLPAVDIPFFAQQIHASQSISTFYDVLSSFLETVFNEEVELVTQMSGKMTTGYHH
ncbi:MAG: hypothetical protein K2X98_05710 [Alphaproteobacteria bacterium]|nr:hypothetical protein [Alphaproteobacteria bacterium]